jgi:hypothetical protein
MDTNELDKLLQDIKELKHSVRKANPFLREIMGLKAYSILSIPLGIILLADCLITHFLIRSSGSFESIPRTWKIVTLTLFALILVIGFAAKWIVIDRRAAQLKDGANFFTVIEAMYGGQWFSLSVPLMLCMFVSSIFAVLSGHPWLIASFTAIFLGPFSNIVAELFDRSEYLWMGWYLTLSGLASLFFMESAPYIWLAIVWAGTFLVFGLAGLAASKPEPGERP